MTIQLPEDLERFVRSEVQSGRFASEQDAITEAVRLLRKADQENAPNSQSSDTPPVQGWQRVLKIMADVPDPLFDRIPADASAQLDHYLYGNPRQPTP